MLLIVIILYRGLAKYLGTVFLLDKYHINKYIKGGLAFCPELRDRLWKAVNSFELDTVKEILTETRKAAEIEKERKRVSRCRRYLVGNWDGILAWRKEAPYVIGCSAEDHVSHVLPVRLSSRPMAFRLGNTFYNRQNPSLNWLKQSSI